MPPTERKISEALLEFADPLLQRHPANPDPEELTADLRIAAMVWNAVVLETVRQPGVYLAEMRSRLRSTVRGRALKNLLSVFDELELRKRRENPMDLRLIGDCECLVDKHGRIAVRASHSPPQEMAEADKSEPKTAKTPRSTDADVDLLLHDFYQIATDFFQLAPWRWMQNGDVFGVQDPESGIVNWCSVMGAGGEMFGLALYLGHEGFDSLRRSAAGEKLDDEALYGLPALVLLFLDRAELSKDDLTRIRQSGVKFRGSGAYPKLESHAVNRMPRSAGEDELRTMGHVLNEACFAASSGLGNEKRFDPDKRGRLLVRAPDPKDPDAPWIDTRREPPPPLEQPLPKIETETIFRLRRETRVMPFEVECDLFPSATIIQEPGQDPYAPPLFMSTHSGTGQIVQCELGLPQDRDAFAQAQFLKMIDLLKARPAVVYVKRPTLLRVVEPLCRMLEMRVKKVDRLHTLDPAREDLARMPIRER